MMNQLTWKYVKPLGTEQAIEQFESSYNVKLPLDLVAVFKQYNGGRPDKKGFNTSVKKERVLKTLLSFNEGDLETIYKAYDVLKPEDDKLIPFASDPAGNYICYQVTDESIVFWEHETNTKEKIADSFTEFLHGLY